MVAKQREEGILPITSVQEAITSAKTDVSKFVMFLPIITKTLEQRLKTYQAGKLTEYLDA